MFNIFIVPYKPNGRFMSKNYGNIIQRVLGILYVFAGIGKFIPYLESVEEVLSKSAIANQNNWLAEPTKWMSDNHNFMTWWVALSMILAGITILLDRKYVKTALYGTLIMIACFMMVLYKSDPKIFIVDIPFITAAIYLLRKKSRSLTNSVEKNNSNK